MKCPKCGSEQLETSLFCGGCGAKLAEYYNARQNPQPTPPVNPNPQNPVRPGVSPNPQNPVRPGVTPNPQNPVRPGVNPNPQNPTRPSSTGGKGSAAWNSTDIPDPSATKKKSGCLTAVLVAVALVLVVIVAAVAGFFMFMTNNQEPTPGPTPVEPTASVETPYEPQNPVVTAPTTTPTPTVPVTQTPENSGQTTVETPSTTTTTPATRNNYLFPSDTQYITRADLQGKTKEEVALIRNEIYARHGYVFRSNMTAKTYFESQSWYTPNPNFSDSMFNEYERANKDFIVNYETEKGWR